MPPPFSQTSGSKSQGERDSSQDASHGLRSIAQEQSAALWRRNPSADAQRSLMLRRHEVCLKQLTKSDPRLERLERKSRAHWRILQIVKTSTIIVIPVFTIFCSLQRGRLETREPSGCAAVQNYGGVPFRVGRWLRAEDAGVPRRSKNAIDELWIISGCSETRESVLKKAQSRRHCLSAILSFRALWRVNRGVLTFVLGQLIVCLFERTVCRERSGDRERCSGASAKILPREAATAIIYLIGIAGIHNQASAPVYDKPMIYYPIQTLINAGIQEILLVTGSRNADFLQLLANGREFGLKHVNHTHQEFPRDSHL